MYIQLTVREYSRARDRHAAESADVVQNSAAVPVALGVVHVRPNVNTLRGVPDAGAYGHGDVICQTKHTFKNLSFYFKKHKQSLLTY